jgi:hypothetical protein
VGCGAYSEGGTVSSEWDRVYDLGLKVKDLGFRV